MGAFYGSIQVRSEDREVVKAAVEGVALECKQKFLLGPLLKGWIAVYPDIYGQGETCAVALAKRLDTILLQLIVHDDDVFIYHFFRNGQWLNTYSSRADYFEPRSAVNDERFRPKPDLFRELVDSPEKLAQISRLLNATEQADEFAFAQERLRHLAGLLGIQNALTCYEYLQAGEREGIKGWKHFLHIPDQKAARKAAAAGLRREKQALRKAGLLCNEWVPPCPKRDAEFSRPDFCSDPLHGGFLVLWRRIVGYGYPPQLQHLQLPWASKPPLVDLVYASTNPNHLTLSPSGNWLALYDRGLRLWDWRNQRLLNDLALEAGPVAFSQDEKWLICQDQQKFTLVSLETRQPVRTIESETPTGVGLVLDPSNTCLVTMYRENQFGILNLETGKLRQVLFSETNPDAPDFLTAVRQLNSAGLRDLWQEEAIGRGKPKILNAKFSPDGRLFFCATTIGLRVYAWADWGTAAEATPKPLYAVVPVPEALQLDLMHYDNFIYDVALDAANNRLLFSGIQGTIRFLNLKDGSNGILVAPPGRFPIWKLNISYDGQFLCCYSLPSPGDTNFRLPLLQVWNYSALCKAAGFE